MGSEAMEGGTVDRAVGVVIDALFEPVPTGPEPHAHGGHAEAIGLSDGFENASDVLAVGCDGFFNEYMFVCFERCDGEIGV